MDKFGSLFGSPFTPGDGEAQTAEDNTDYGNMRMDYNGPDIAMPPSPGVNPRLVGGPAERPIFGPTIPEVDGPVMPPDYDMPSPAVLPPGFDDNMPQPGVMPSPIRGQIAGGPAQRINPGMFNDIFKSLPGLFGRGQIGPGGRTMPMPQPTPMPFRQPNFRPDTRAPGGGGMDYNGNPIGGGMGAQFNFAGPRTGIAQPLPMPQQRMSAPMRPAPGPVRPATSIKRPRIR